MKRKTLNEDRVPYFLHAVIDFIAYFTIYKVFGFEICVVFALSNISTDISRRNKWLGR